MSLYFCLICLVELVRILHYGASHKRLTEDNINEKDNTGEKDKWLECNLVRVMIYKFVDII